MVLCIKISINWTRILSFFILIDKLHIIKFWNTFSIFINCICRTCGSTSIWCNILNSFISCHASIASINIAINTIQYFITIASGRLHRIAFETFGTNTSCTTNFTLQIRITRQNCYRNCLVIIKSHIHQFS